MLQHCAAATITGRERSAKTLAGLTYHPAAAAVEAGAVAA